jgi:phenylpropionate dioxygenase-like ring-hydroxylating dioxygenase large terminal subunit
VQEPRYKLSPKIAVRVRRIMERLAEILRGCWYVIGGSIDVRRGQMIAARLGGVPIVVVRRSTGALFALRDTCPHRGVPLHYGRVLNDTVECPYHGWRYNAEGVCVEIPSLSEDQLIDISKIRCQKFQAMERYGLVWVYLPQTDELATAAQMPQPPELPGIPPDAAPQAAIKMHFPSSIDHSVLSLMDLTHAPFVHKLWWFKKEPGKLRPKEKVFEPTSFGFRMKRHKVPPQNLMYHRLLGDNASTEIHYMLPGFRIEHTFGSRNWAVALTAHTPLDAGSTVVFQCFWTSIPWFSVLAPVVRSLARVFLGQDRHYVVLQQEGLQSNPKTMMINDADTQARWWMRLKHEWTSSQLNNTPFFNPLAEQTLRWRS